ncbi:MAG: SAF domain-containing protein [Pseudonocardiaceae bacterium]
MGPKYTLAPLLRERWDALWRGPGFARTLVLRRAAAALLVGLAVVLALRPGTGSAAGIPVVVAARDLTPGTMLGTGDVVVRGLPEQVVPDGAARSTPDVLGRTLAAPVRRGEPLTDLRLAGPTLARAVSADPSSVSVALRLPDSDIAALLYPGASVDVLTLGPRQDEPVVLASGARVLAVLEPGAGTTEGRLVLVALEAAAATRVAAASLSQAVTVTLR